MSSFWVDKHASFLLKVVDYNSNIVIAEAGTIL